MVPETMLYSGLPSGWRRQTLGEMISETGAELKTGPFGTVLKASEYSPQGVPVVSVGEIKAGRIAIRPETPRVSEEVTSRLSEYVLRAGDVVFARKGGVERTALVGQREDGWFLGSDGIRLRLPGAYFPPYVAHQFQTSGVKQWLVAHATGSTMPSLSQNLLRRLPIPVPPLPQQRKIAAILSSVDDAITATRKVIEQTKRVKQGLLQTLMARGIGHRRFKTTEIGEIPEAWEVVGLGDLGHWTSGGTPSKSRQEFWGGSVPWVTPKDMKVSTIRSSEDRITGEAVAAGARLLPPGALLVVVRGMILAHTFPVATTECAVTINQDMKALVPTDRLNVSFALAWLQLNEASMLARVSEATHGTKRLTQNELLSFLMPIPPREEQDEIVSALACPQKVIECECRRLDRLNILKRGLMQDLLTGRVRVQPD